MNFTKPLLLAAVSISACIPLAASAAVPTYTQGDIFMGFRVESGAGVGTSYLVNIGSAASFRDATGPITLDLGDIATDLKTFGDDWRSLIHWGIAGTPSNIADVSGDTVPTLYASKRQATAGVPGTGWSVAGADTRIAIATRMVSFQNFYHSPAAVATDNSPRATFQSTGDALGWTSYMYYTNAPQSSNTAGNKDFGAFSDIEGSGSDTLSLFRVTGPSAGSYEGYFSISEAGVVTFTPPSAGTTYTTWASANVGGQAGNLDFDNDGIPNGVEFFMGSNGTTPNAHVGVEDGAITWPRASGTVVGSFKVQTSGNLEDWNDVPSNDPNYVVTGSSVKFTLPAGETKLFVRLVVTP